MSSRYFKRDWDESRGDEYDAWGTSTYLFQTSQDGSVVRQLQIYEDGHILKYDETHDDDAYGGIAVHPLPLDEFESFEISEQDFLIEWNLQDPFNW